MEPGGNSCQKFHMVVFALDQKIVAKLHIFTRFVCISLRSTLSAPWKRRDAVTDDTTWKRSTLDISIMERVKVYDLAGTYTFKMLSHQR